MPMTTSISKYSVGIGDRFGLEGADSCGAFLAARDRGVTITRSGTSRTREHSLIGTDLRRAAEADAAVKACQWTGPYFVDAESTSAWPPVDKFSRRVTFFTIDVADSIGKSAADSSIAKYTADMQRFSGALRIPGIAEPVTVSPAA